MPAIEIGGTHVTATFVDLASGTVVAESVQIARLNPAGAAEEILGAIMCAGCNLSVPPGERWGVAVPGPFDYLAGVGLFAGVGKFESLYGVDVGAALLGGLPGPPRSVTFLNDADAFLLGEWLFGAAAGHDRCVAVTLGTGIGSAFLADGSLHHNGAGVPPEGRVDLLRIAGQPLEEVVSARAIERAYQQRTGLVPSGTADVAQRARAGDVAAIDVLRVSFEQLGETLSPWFSEFRAEVLVVGGAMTGSWDIIGPFLVRGLEAGAGSSAPVVRATVAARPQQAALLGAASNAQGTRPVAAPLPGGVTAGSDKHP